MKIAIPYFVLFCFYMFQTSVVETKPLVFGDLMNSIGNVTGGLLGSVTDTMGAVGDMLNGIIGGAGGLVDGLTGGAVNTVNGISCGVLDAATGIIIQQDGPCKDNTKNNSDSEKKETISRSTRSSTTVVAANKEK